MNWRRTLLLRHVLRKQARETGKRSMGILRENPTWSGATGSLQFAKLSSCSFAWASFDWLAGSVVVKLAVC